MGKKIVDFSYKVKGDFSPNGLQKVFFSYHPDDIKQMELIANDILTLIDCVIYFHSDLENIDEINIDDFKLKLRDMKLFIVIVTTNYLKSNNFAKNWEYAFAIDNKIPVLAITMEYGIEELFASEMNYIRAGFGDIQLLRYQVSDSTEISYYQKLERDLNSILVNGDDIARIKDAFQSQIFLSYRKKDRKYANELIRMIHSIPDFQSVSIWYDEFISSGESWSNQIQEALKSSDIFLLMVTPSITEPDNYVIRKEYPAAKENGMTIVSARKASAHYTDQDLRELSRLFPDISTWVDGDDAESLKQALSDIAVDIDTTPEKDYLVGLAFFNGINVEKDSEKAVSLIIASAKKGLLEAMNKLSDMFWNGDGVEVNHESSIEWRKKLISLYETKRSDNQGTSKDIYQYIKALERLCIDLYELSSYRDALYYVMKLLEQTTQFMESEEQEKYYWYYSSACDLAGKICMRLGLYDKAEDYFRQYCSFYRKRYDMECLMENLYNLSVGYERIGDVKYAVGDYQQASQWYFKALPIRKEIDEKQGSIDSAYSLSCIYLVLGDIQIRNHVQNEADKMYEKAVSLRKRILDAEDTSANRKAYGEAILARGTARYMTNNQDTAKRLFDAAADIFEKLAEESETLEAWRSYSVVLNRQGAVAYKQEDYREAITFYQESLECRKKILAYSRVNGAVFDCALTLVLMARCYRELFDKVQEKSLYEEAIELLLPVLSGDKNGDWHYTFSEAAFERFKMDTFAGKKYLKQAISGWKWLTDKYPNNETYRKKCELCQKMYQRCYPD